MRQVDSEEYDASRRTSVPTAVPAPRGPALSVPAPIPPPRDDSAASALVPYVPRMVSEWEMEAGDRLWREIDATCCFVDISGFTALSERLARRGRVGAEVLTVVLNHVFSRMLDLAYEHGGTLLKFGGDALLLAFTRLDHPVEAARAAVKMRAALREARDVDPSLGRINLRMSVGMHAGTFHMFRVGRSHQELLITGPGASTTTRMEQAAEAGEIVVSADMAARLPRTAVGAEKGAGRLLRWRSVPSASPGLITPRVVVDKAIEESVPVALRHWLANAVGGPEHRIASVGFVKYTGLDALMSNDGPQAAAEALQEIVGCVQDAADAESVTFLASDIDADGGKIILTTGVPTTMDDDEGRLVRTARAIVSSRLPLPVRVGLNRGYVFAADIGTQFRRTFTVMGDTVNVAARLMAAASPHEVYATPSILENSRTGFAVETLEPLTVKGKSEPLRAFRVGESTGPKSSGPGTLPFRGRDTELAQLLEAAERAHAGRGNVAVLEGERGGGKSRLVAELLAATPDAPAIVFQGEPYGTGAPYFALRDAVRGLLAIESRDRREAGSELVAALGALDESLVPYAPFLAPIVDADVDETEESRSVGREFARQQVAEVFVRTLAAARPGPLTILAEDSHWYDETSSGICTRLAEETKRRPWFLCLARRPGDSGFDVVDPRLQLDLVPIGDDAARGLIDEVTAAAPLRPHERDEMVSRAGGNPLFLEELLRLVQSGDSGALPESVESVAMRQIDALPTTARHALRLASVLGRSFPRELLRELLAAEQIDTDDELLATLQSHLVSEGPDRLTFRHAVLREAAYESLPFRTRVQLHALTADTLERTARSPDDVAAELSFHVLAAQDWERSWVYSRLAARQATKAYAPAETATHLQRAANAARRLSGVASDQLATVLGDLGWTLELLGEYDRADEAYRQAVALSKADPLACARLADRRAYVRSEFQGRPTAALRQVRVGQAAIAGLQTAEAARLNAKLFAREAAVRRRQGDYRRAIASSEIALRAAEAAGDPGALAFALGIRDGCLMELGRVAEATHLGQALELYEQVGDMVRAAETLSVLGARSFYLSCWDDAAQFYERSATMAEAAGDLAGAACARANIGELRVNQGRLAEATELLSGARRTLEAFSYRYMVAWASMHLGRALALGGDVDNGIAMLGDAAQAFLDVDARTDLAEARAHIAEVLLASGAVEEAAAVLAEARASADITDETPLGVLLDRLEVTIRAATGEPVGSDLVEQIVVRARRLNAMFDLRAALILSERLGLPHAEDKEADLVRGLGIVDEIALVLDRTAAT
jgi:class 3 adenylate cyclase/tetratricopeptide (TPR) repeat protein